MIEVPKGVKTENATEKNKQTNKLRKDNKFSTQVDIYIYIYIYTHTKRIPHVYQTDDRKKIT